MTEPIELASSSSSITSARSTRDMPSQQSVSEPISLENQPLQRSTVRKLDLILLPFLALIFLFNSLDRSNVGNAETADFMANVGLDEDDLNTAIALFFVFFVTLQPVGAAVGRRVGMSIWVPACMALWGTCTTLHCWISARWQLFALRIVIGILEAGFYPVAVSYLSLFYTRFEFGRRLALFYGQYALAGALGGGLSYLVFSQFDREGHEHKDGDWYPWQVLFMIEGLATVTIAMIGFFWLPRSPGTAWFLSKDERRWAEERIRLDRTVVSDSIHPNKSAQSDYEEEEDTFSGGGESSEGHRLLSSSMHSAHTTYSMASSRHFSDSQGLSPHDILGALLSPKIYHLLLCNILSSIPVTAFSIFLPLVLKSLSPTPALANLLTVPPYLCGAIVLYAFTSWSDRHQERFRPILVSLAVLLIGLLLVVMIPSGTGWAFPRYLSLCVLISGTFVASPLTIAWISGNTPAPGKRALLLGLNGWGNLAGIFSAMIFSPRFAPSYQVSFWLSAACVGASAAGYFLFRTFIVRENAWRERVVSKWNPADVKSEESGGLGPLGGSDDSRLRLLNVLVDVLAYFKLETARIWVEGVKQEARDGDERVTFTYGL